MSNRIQRRSVPSARSARQSIIITSDDAYSYALRAAYLHHLLQPRPRRQIPARPAPNINRSSTSSFNDLIADFSHSHRDGKTTRLPRDFLSVLQKRLEAVIMGRESHIEYKDALVKRVFGTFYAAFKEPRFYDGVKSSRRTEDLVLIFYSSATKELQQRKTGDDSWKQLVDRHVALFVRLMKSIIRDHGWSGSHPELHSRLATLEDKLLHHDMNLADEPGQTKMILGPPEPASSSVNDMPMVKQVSRVFGVILEVCQQDIDRNKTLWTEKAALQDLKAYIDNLNLNTRRTLRSEDFDLDEAYDLWKKDEKTLLSKQMLAIIQSNPTELAKTTSNGDALSRRPGHAHTMSSSSLPNRSSVSSFRSSIYGGLDSSSLSGIAESANVDSSSLSNGSSVEEGDTPYVYIPPDARLFYRHLMEKCLAYDALDPDIVQIEPPGADAPIALYSKASMALLDECALRWRLPHYSRYVLLMDIMKGKFAEQEIDLETLDSLIIYFKSEVGYDWTYWTIADQDMFRSILAGLHDSCLRELYDRLQHAFDNKAVPIGRVMWILEQHIYEDPLFTANNVDDYVAQLKEGLKSRAEEVLYEMLGKLPAEREVMDPSHVVDLTQKVVKLTEKVSKRFKERILGSVDPMMIFIEVVYPKYAVEISEVLLNMIEFYKEKGEDLDIEDGFDMYRELTEVRRLYGDAFQDSKFPIALEDLFVDCAWRYVSGIESKIIGWVDAAIREDGFLLTIREEQGREPEDHERHTSSVVDVFRSFNQPVDYMMKLGWQDPLQYAKFMTALAKILGSGVMRYCEVLEKLFTFEMSRPTEEQERAARQTKQQKWVALAKEAWNNKEKIEPFQFAPESCVKLNNIEFAIQQFDKLEHTVDADGIADIVQRYEPPTPRKKKQSYVFTIKIVEAEDLKAMDINGYSDPYVVLGDEYQKRLAKTRVVYSNLNPRWEETFDITAQGPIWLTATLWDWDTLGDHDCLGRTNIKLDPAAFMDFLPKELWLDLDTQGRLLLRVSMEGERDDIQFHFGKAFRTLKRTERDMTRQITDKLSAYIHHCLSRSALKSVLSKGYSMSTVSSLFSRTGFNNRPPSTPASGTGITEGDIAAAISPLTDYFNENFAILNQTLTSSAMTLVMSRLWKEVLVTLETLLVPTLSDKPSQQRQLTTQETEVVFKWLRILYDFFLAVDEATGEATGVPIDVLKSPKYHELQSLNFFYFESTDNLIRTSERMANAAAARQQQSRQKMMGVNTAGLLSPGGGNSLGVPGMGIKRGKSVMMSRNLGTMRKAKEEKRSMAQAEPNDDMILRILRMRPEAGGYLKDRSRQKERLEATAAAEAIVRQSMGQGAGRMGRVQMIR